MLKRTGGCLPAGRAPVPDAIPAGATVSIQRYRPDTCYSCHRVILLKYPLSLTDNPLNPIVVQQGAVVVTPAGIL